MVGGNELGGMEDEEEGHWWLMNLEWPLLFCFIPSLLLEFYWPILPGLYNIFFYFFFIFFGLTFGRSEG